MESEPNRGTKSESTRPTINGWLRPSFSWRWSCIYHASFGTIGKLEQWTDFWKISVSDEWELRNDVECQTMSMFTDSPIINEDCWNNQRERLIRYLHGPKRYHRLYAVKYYFCELLAFFALVRNSPIFISPEKTICSNLGKIQIWKSRFFNENSWRSEPNPYLCCLPS